MPNVLVMSQKERDHVAVIKEVSKGLLSAREAAKILVLSRRHVFRLVLRYRQSGDAGLIHRLRGQASNHGHSPRIKARVLELYWRSEYRDYGPTLFSEILAENYKIHVDHETIRRWLMASGGTNVQRRKRPHRSKRQRRSAIGEMVQFDGSEHDWFEGRGPICTLLHMIDDASGRVFLRFAPSENTADCMRTFWAYVERHGVPASLYIDYGGVFHAPENTLTDFGRAMAALGVRMIYAGSPQAKGRVERGNRTHQDRLIKALRRLGISSIAGANHFLEHSYIEDHNTRFALPADRLPDVHRRLDKSIHLERILCFQTLRCLRHDFTITLDATYIQILKGPYVLPRPRQYLILRRYLNGTLHIFAGQQELRFQALSAKPAPRKAPVNYPAHNHPWRTGHLIGKSRRNP